MFFRGRCHPGLAGTVFDADASNLCLHGRVDLPSARASSTGNLVGESQSHSKKGCLLKKVLKAEVARMQTLHPERLGEPAPQALILHGQVPPLFDDPGHRLCASSDAQTVYSVNGVCSARPTARQGCRHLRAWSSACAFAGKVEAPPVPRPRPRPRHCPRLRHR